MTLREWCQRGGHPLVLLVYAEGSHPIYPTLAPVGHQCVCGERRDVPGEQRATKLIMPPCAVDATGRDRTR